MEKDIIGATHRWITNAMQEQYNAGMAEGLAKAARIAESHTTDYWDDHAGKDIATAIRAAHVVEDEPYEWGHVPR